VTWRLPSRYETPSIEVQPETPAHPPQSRTKPVVELGALWIGPDPPIPTRRELMLDVE
jgi:hypothetical protein